ncbi:MAG TPA: septation ring formation regulator EzrA [Bacilli bacterium]|nr:septation ring formation regulator EzrA [Bacilli bacterium]
MSSTTFTLLAIGYYILAVTLVILVLNFISKKEKKVYKDEINSLERDKNLIISASILSELNKVESLVNNEKMEQTYQDWQKRFKKIKDEEVPKISDDLLEIEDLFQEKNYKTLKQKIAQIELQIYYVKTRANFLLEEIKEITLSEEKNRETITKLKIIYREIFSKYNQNKSDYKLIASPIELQFENVDKLFSAFEIAMDEGSFSEVGKIVKAIDDTIGNLKLIIEEAPSIIMMGKTIIPKKISDITTIHDKMVKEGYNLDYLNIEYNVTETEKKISDIFARLNVLNIEDSIFELKTMVDYYDSLYNDFDKERISKKIFEDYSRTILVRVTKLSKVNNELLKKLGAIKYSYDLTDEDVKVVDKIKQEFDSIKKEYDHVISSHRSKSFAYSRLAKEMELLNVRLTKAEEKLEMALRTFGSLKEDELRAREQLDEIKEILKKAKYKIKSYKLPLIPKKYYVELSEATLAVKEMIKELEKKPISIKVLNTRVDTARDLALKLFNTTNETVKTAWMAETAIVYGNRYRPVNKDINLGLTKAENLFNKGNFKASLENAINTINIVEPGIHQRLLDAYQQ